MLGSNQHIHHCKLKEKKVKRNKNNSLISYPETEKLIRNRLIFILALLLIFEFILNFIFVHKFSFSSTIHIASPFFKQIYNEVPTE